MIALAPPSRSACGTSNLLTMPKIVGFAGGFGMALKADINGFRLEATAVYEDAPGNTFNVKVRGDLETPGGLGFTAGLDIVANKLRNINLGMKGSRIAIGTTGFFRNAPHRMMAKGISMNTFQLYIISSSASSSSTLPAEVLE